jgi:tRNA A-37 threonylcarbamoyl transferase component Bud32
MQPSTGLMLGQRYHLTNRIAIGGMGEVWAAHDDVLERSVAIKMLRPELVEAPGFVARLRAEARHAAGLSHAGIAGVYDYVEDDSGAFLVMELVPGRPLSDVLAAQRVPPLTTTLSILAQTAEALDAAHRGGVVHRDVKPGNILVLPDGTVKVTDFGIAKAMEGAETGEQGDPLTVHGQVVGTPQYMSPEQVQGQPATAAADIYALGVIGYEMLSGGRPFPGDNALALAVAHAHEVPPPLPESVPEPVRALIERAMSKRAEDRPPTAAAFAIELRELQMENMPPPATVAPVDSPPTLAEGIASHPPTDIMPAAGVAVGAPLLVVDQAALDRRRGSLRWRSDREGTGAPVPRPTRRWAKVALVGLACVVAVALLLRLDGNGSRRLSGGGLDAAASSSVAAANTATTTPATPASTAPPVTETTAPAPAPVAETVAPIVVDPHAFIGSAGSDATNALRALGFVVDTHRVKSGQPAGTVVDVSPSGPLAPGSHVTVSISGGNKGKGKD